MLYGLGVVLVLSNNRVGIEVRSTLFRFQVSCSTFSPLSRYTQTSLFFITFAYLYSRMSLIEEKRGNKRYYTFQMGAGRKLYLGPVDDPDPEKVREAMKYPAERIEHYSTVLKQLQELLDTKERRRRPPIQISAQELSQDERTALIRLSLAESGLSSYELERRGVRANIMASIEKLSKLGLIRRISKVRTPAGRLVEKYIATSTGAQIALENLSRETKADLDVHRLREMSEGNFEKTPIGVAYLRTMRLKTRADLR